MKQFILKLELKETNISRKICINENVSFFELHDIIQIVFGWGNNHLHHFKIGQWVIGDYEDENELPVNYTYEGEVNLSSILDNESEMVYEYDFGDGWIVDIKVVEREIIKGEQDPEILECNGPMVSENCGGPSGLSELPTVEASLESLNFLLATYYRNKK